jgi:integrase
MTTRRSKGDGGLHWDTGRQRWIATASLGHAPNGKRIVKRGSGKTKTEAKNKLKEVLRDYEDGLAIAPADYTVAHAVNDWLQYGLSGRAERTIRLYKEMCDLHVSPELGARKIRDLSADEVDRWLALKSKTLSTRTLHMIHGCLNRSIKRAMARDKVKRNVVALCSVPTGQPGRISKALSLGQAEAILTVAAGTRMYPYIVVALLTGARSEEMRALTWDHVHFPAAQSDGSPVPAHIAVWRSVRIGGDTKTKRSRRTLALPQRCVTALERQRQQQETDRAAAGSRWQEHGLVFASKVGTQLDPSHVQRDFRKALAGIEGFDPRMWTPRELRHSFVSLLSDQGIAVEEISRLVGHRSTAVTEVVYRKQIRPVLQSGAIAMDQIFGATDVPPVSD